MQEVEFTIPRSCDLASGAQLVEEVCSALGLHVAMKGTLASYPGCVHWHYKKQREKGTLELTLLPGGRRIWASVHSGRKASWIETLLPRVRRDVELALRRTARSP